MIKNITKLSISMIVLSSSKSYAADVGKRPMECTHPRWLDRFFTILLHYYHTTLLLFTNLYYYYYY